jgi:sec-independent protein translocase protein TatC
MSRILPEGVTYAPDISHYLDVVLGLFVAFGCTFEIPVATVLLVLMGVTSSAALVEKRPWIIVGCFVVAAVLTPPDALSQVMLATPMWLLFEVGIFFARMLERRDTVTD